MRPIERVKETDEELIQRQINELINAGTEQLYKNAYNEALDDILESMKKGMRRHDDLAKFTKFLAGEIKTLREICSSSSLLSQ